MAWTPIAVARCVLPVPGPPTRTTVGVFQELAAMELTCERLVDLAAGEVEAGEIAIVRKAGGLELIGRRSDLSVGRLRFQKLRQDWHGGFEGRGALFGQLADRLSHAVHFETAQQDDDRAGGRIMTHGAPRGLCARRRIARRWLGALCVAL